MFQSVVAGTTVFSALFDLRESTDPKTGALLSLRCPSLVALAPFYYFLRPKVWLFIGLGVELPSPMTAL